VNFFRIEKIRIQISGDSEKAKSTSRFGKNVIRKGDGDIDGRTE
jgi:hypothetical protein